MSVFQLCGAAIASALLIAVIRRFNPEYALAAGITASLLILASAFAKLLPQLEFLRSLTEGEGVGKYYTVMVKALGIALLTESAADICADSGENGLRGKVELLGKIEIMVIALPLAGEMLSLARQLLS